MNGTFSDADIARFCVVNALRLPNELVVSIAVKLLQHLSFEDRSKALTFSDPLPPFDESLRLLRDLADLQNGAPLYQYKDEWEETMKLVYCFLNKWEKK